MDRSFQRDDATSVETLESAEEEITIDFDVKQERTTMLIVQRLIIKEVDRSLRMRRELEVGA